MKEQLISFETAILAKEIGFEQTTPFWWVNYYAGNPVNKWKVLPAADLSISWMEYAAPTQSLLQKWLREEKNIIVEANWIPDTKSYAPRMLQKALTPKLMNHLEMLKYVKVTEQFFDMRVDTYEEALETALKGGLMLIKNK